MDIPEAEFKHASWHVLDFLTSAEPTPCFICNPTTKESH